MNKLYKVYNSSNLLVWVGDQTEFEELRLTDLINTTDRIVVEEQ